MADLKYLLRNIIEKTNEKATIDYVDEKVGSVSITEADPTVPAWAKAATKPNYTAEEVGADSKGSAAQSLVDANAYTDTKIADLVNNTQDTLDTLGKLADALKENEGVVEALNSAITNKQDKITGAATSIISGDLTTDKILISDGNGKVAVSNWNSSYLDKLGKIDDIEKTADNAELLAKLALPGTLKWDGYIGDRPYVIFAEDGDFSMAFVHLYDDELIHQAIMSGMDLSDKLIGIINADGEAYLTEFGLFGTGENGLTLWGGGTSASDVFAFLIYVPQDNIEADQDGLPMIFPKRGIYLFAEYYDTGIVKFPVSYTSILAVEGYYFQDKEDDVGKYFEAIEEDKEVVNLGDTITWDGNIEGREMLIIGETTLVKMSTSVPTLSELNSIPWSATLVIDSVEYQCDSLLGSEDLDIDNLSVIAYDGFELSVFILHSDIVFEGITVKSGVYFLKESDNKYCSSFTLEGYNFKLEKKTEKIQLKEEHLPNTVFDISADNKIDWDGIIGDRIAVSGIIDGDSVYLTYVSDYIPNMEALSQDDISLQADMAGSSVELSPTLIEIYDGFYGLIERMIGDVPIVAFVMRDNISFTYTDGSSYTFPKAGTYFLKVINDGELVFTAKSLTASSIKVPIIKIKKSVLPDDIGGGTFEGMLTEADIDELMNLLR